MSPKLIIHTNVSKTSQRPTFIVYHTVAVRMHAHAWRCVCTPTKQTVRKNQRTQISANTTSMANTRKQNVHAGMGKALADRCWACAHAGHAQVWRAHARNRYSHTKGVVNISVAIVNCVAGYVCGNMYNAQSKACAGGLYVDHLGYCPLAQVGSRSAIAQIGSQCTRPPEKCDPHQWWKTARTITLLRAAKRALTRLRGQERQLRARIQCPWQRPQPGAPPFLSSLFHIGGPNVFERGAWLGQADVVPPGRGGGQGFRRRPLFLFCLY